MNSWMGKGSLSICVFLCISCAYAFELSEGLDIEPSGRYRYQDVNDELRGDAQASTLLLRLSADWEIDPSWQTFAQFDVVTAFNENNYNSVTVNRRTSPIPDPAGEELNQLYIRYKSDDNWSAALGRQAISFDNERHIGRVEFWQNDQTFDALNFLYQDNLNWQASYVYLKKAHRIFGDDAKSILSAEDIRFEDNPVRSSSELGNHQHDSHLINTKYIFSRQLELSFYAYLLNNKTARTFSSDTFGLRLTGELKPGRIKYGYTLEYARQSDSQDNPWNFNADYWLVEASAQYKSHQFGLTYEKLGADNGFGFATTLGTNHKFQGWADVFSSYLSRGGLKDYSVSYRGRDGKLRWRIVVHQFESDGGGETAGHELDIELAYRYNREWEFKFIAARYEADEGFSSLPVSQQNLSTWMLSAAYNL